MTLVGQRLIEVGLWPFRPAHKCLAIANPFHHVFTDFIATHGVVRTDHRDQIRRRKAVLFDEAVDRGLRDTGRGPPPSGMDRGNGAALTIGNEDGNAIGGLNAQRRSTKFRHCRVACQRLVCGPGVGHLLNDARMRLFQLQQRPARHARGCQKPRPVELDRRIGGTVGSEREFIVLRPPSGKCVDDAWNSLQSRRAKERYLRNTFYL